MQTLTIDILSSHAEKLLEDLEKLQLIRVRKERKHTPSVINWAGTYKNSIFNQPSKTNTENEFNGQSSEGDSYPI